MHKSNWFTQKTDYNEGDDDGDDDDDDEDDDDNDDDDGALVTSGNRERYLATRSLKYESFNFLT